jgi:hypothetical protein
MSFSHLKAIWGWMRKSARTGMLATLLMIKLLAGGWAYNNGYYTDYWPYYPYYYSYYGATIPITTLTTALLADFSVTAAIMVNILATAPVGLARPRANQEESVPSLKAG